MSIAAAGTLDWSELLHRKGLEEAAAAQRAQPNVPDFIPSFAYKRDLHSFDAKWTLVGLLWVRLERHRTNQHGTMMRPAPIKFAVEGVSIIDAIVVAHEGSPAIAVIVLHNNAAMILHDDYNLFPSDTLVGKIITLKDA